MNSVNLLLEHVSSFLFEGLQIICLENDTHLMKMYLHTMRWSTVHCN